jgi:hypothetical protein
MVFFLSQTSHTQHKHTQKWTTSQQANGRNE